MAVRSPASIPTLNLQGIDLVDRGADTLYREQGLNYRARYTPLMRVLADGKQTVSEITTRVRVTQGAVSQTLRLMVTDGLVACRSGPDARQTTVSLTASGRRLLARLEKRWAATFRAVATLEAELGVPLRDILLNAIAALERKSFAERLRESTQSNPRAYE